MRTALLAWPAGRRAAVCSSPGSPVKAFFGTRWSKRSETSLNILKDFGWQQILWHCTMTQFLPQSCSNNQHLLGSRGVGCLFTPQSYAFHIGSPLGSSTEGTTGLGHCQVAMEPELQICEAIRRVSGKDHVTRCSWSMCLCWSGDGGICQLKPKVISNASVDRWNFVAPSATLIRFCGFWLKRFLRVVCAGLWDLFVSRRGPPARTVSHGANSQKMRRCSNPLVR